MGKRSAAASRERRIVKRHQVHLKKRAEWARKRNLCLGKTPVSALQRLPGPSHLPSHIHEAVCECSEHFSSAVRSVKDNGGFTTSPPERVDVDSALSWSSSVDEESPPSICNRIKEATEEELPVVVVDEQRAIEVHLKSGLTRGSQVLKLSTEEFFQRVVEKEEKRSWPSNVCVIKLKTSRKNLLQKNTCFEGKRKKPSVRFEHFGEIKYLNVEHMEGKCSKLHCRRNDNYLVPHAIAIYMCTKYVATFKY